MSRLSAIALVTLASLIGLGTPASPARADESSFWVVPGEIDSYEQKLFEASRLADAAIRLRMGNRHDILAQEKASSLAERAIKVLESASDLRPDEVTPHYHITLIIERHFTRGKTSPRPRLVELIRHYDAIEAKDPLFFDMSSVYFNRSIALTKLGGDANFRKGVEDYDRALMLVDPASQWVGTLDNLATTESNRAELLMALGQLDESIQAYEDALKHSDKPLYGYGLAVALDRDGQGRRAREVMGHYARVTPKGKNPLFGTDIFFVPEGEIHYYEAMLYEALGETKEAIDKYQEFLRALPKSQWAARAKQNIADLKRRPTNAPRSPRHLEALERTERRFVP